MDAEEFLFDVGFTKLCLFYDFYVKIKTSQTSTKLFVCIAHN